MGPLIKLVVLAFLLNIIYADQALGTQYSALSTQHLNKYEAIVEGKITKQKVKKINGYYVTEYKLKPNKWLYKKPEVEKKRSLTLRVLGAELPKKGIVIKASTSPGFVPIQKEAIFLLEKTKQKHKNIFTVSNNGIIYKDI